MPQAKSFYEGSLAGSDDESTATLLERSDHIIPGRRASRGKRLVQCLVVLVAIVCTVSMVYTAFAVHEIASMSQTDYGDCGTDETVEQARAKGCVFDPMGWAWVRPECYDEALALEYLNKTEFTFHTEPQLLPETQLPMEVIFRGDHPKLFTQKKYHDIHCAYMWKRMHMSIQDRTPIDAYMIQMHHTEHCQMVMLDKWLHEDVQCTEDMICPTWLRASWTTCKRY